ncbi:MAG: AMP-binding protein, partial [Longimicrobiales bacterium]|nr:AMP-binding protein [Longimicrobiales bacterium]
MSNARDFGPYAGDLDPRPANHRPLSPLTFLQRSARVYPDYTSVIHGERRFSWSETYARCRRLASALSRRGISRGDTVSIMATNTPALYEAHFGVPMSGA